MLGTSGAPESVGAENFMLIHSARYKAAHLTIIRGLLLLAALSGAPSAALAQCSDVVVSTFTQLDDAINDFNANCGNGDVLTAWKDTRSAIQKRRSPNS
jgi:hypothetical protein